MSRVQSPSATHLNTSVPAEDSLYERLTLKIKINLPRAGYSIGVVEAFNENNGLLKVKGYTFCESSQGGGFMGKKSPRTKILSLTSGSLIVYSIDMKSSIEQAKLVSNKKKLLLTDGGSFELDLSETEED